MAKDIHSANELKNANRTGAILFRDSTPFDPNVSSILSVTVAHESAKSLTLSVEYNAAESESVDAQIFVLPDMPYWAQRPAVIKRGRNTTTVIVDLNYVDMEKKAVTEAVSTYLSAYVETYSEGRASGPIAEQQIPFKKVWVLE